MGVGIWATIAGYFGLSVSGGVGWGNHRNLWFLVRSVGGFWSDELSKEHVSGAGHFPEGTGHWPRVFI